MQHLSTHIWVHLMLYIHGPALKRPDSLNHLLWVAPELYILKQLKGSKLYQVIENLLSNQYLGITHVQWYLIANQLNCLGKTGIETTYRLVFLWCLVLNLLMTTSMECQEQWKFSQPGKSQLSIWPFRRNIVFRK